MLPWDLRTLGGNYAAQTVSSGGGSSSVIVSIEQGSKSMAATVGIAAYSLNQSVTAANTLVVYQGVINNGAEFNLGRTGTRVTLTDGNTVTINRDNVSTDAVTAYFSIIQFASSVVNSIQYGIVTIPTSGTSATTTLGTVGANSFVMYLGSSSANGTQTITSMNIGLSLVTSTGVVTATCSAQPTSNSVVVSFVVVDLNTTAVSAVQTPTPLTSTANSATDTATGLTSVDTNNTILINAGTVSASTSDSGSYFYGNIASSTSVTFTRNASAGTGSRTHYYSLVTFASGVLNGAVQRPGPINLSSASSGTASITTLAGYSATPSSNKSFVNWTGFNGTATTNDYQEYTHPYLTLTNATTVTAGTSAAGLNTVSIGFEAINFT